MNFCVDCKYFQTSVTGREFGKCAADRAADPVTGDGGEYAALMRKWEASCGREGKWFELAPPKPPQPSWLKRLAGWMK